MRSIQFLLGVVVVVATSNQVHAGALYECADQSDCPRNPDAECVDNFCTCKPGSTLTIDGLRCLPLAKQITDACETDEQCAIIGGRTRCASGECVCEEGFVYLKRACIPRLKNSDACSHTDDCFDGANYYSRTCDNGKCQCAPGYYDRAGFDCRLLSDVGGKCAIPSDCKDSVCVDGECKVDVEEPTGEDAVEDDVEDDVQDRALEVECMTNDDCSDANSWCSPILKLCACRKGFFKKSKKCVPELGTQCKVNEAGKSDCPLGSKCINDICGCEVPKFFDETNQKCKKSATMPSLECATDDSCKFLGDNYFCDNGDKICKCNNGFRMNEDYICVDNHGCESDKECEQEMSHSFCNADKACVCLPDYAQQGKLCLPRIGGVCKTSDECEEITGNSECTVGNICGCSMGYVPDGYRCLQEKQLGAFCEIDAQCARKSDSSCTNTTASGTAKLCVCKEGFMNVKGNCLRMATRIGDYCTTPVVCMEGSVCLKSKCTCQNGMKPTPDRASCYQPESNGTITTHGGHFLTINTLLIIWLHVRFFS